MLVFSDRSGRWLGRAFIAMAAAMVPWLVYLGATVPGTVLAPHWRAARVGLDSGEAAALLATGRFLVRADNRCVTAAMSTSVLLCVDAWFDLTTSAPGGGLAITVEMAVFTERPIAALCAALARHPFPPVSGHTGEPLPHSRSCHVAHPCPPRRLPSRRTGSAAASASAALAAGAWWFGDRAPYP